MSKFRSIPDEQWQLGPDPFALIQAFEADFSCAVEWMRLKGQGFFGRRRSARSRR